MPLSGHQAAAKEKSTTQWTQKELLPLIPVAGIGTGKEKWHNI